MKNSILILIVLILSLRATAQDPGTYMNLLGENYSQITKDTWDYVRQSSRGRNASKIEKRRLELVATLKSAKYKVTKVGSYQGDLSLKDAVSSYLNISYLVMNDNYKKIVDLERIAEESYNSMEAYILTKERVDEKLDSAYAVLRKAQDDFISEYNVPMSESSGSRVSKKLRNAGVVSKYYNQLFLLYFKSSWYEGQMIDAQNKEKLGDMEQFRQSLELISKEGMKAVKGIAGYQGDNDLKDACFQMLEFYYGEAVRYMPIQIDFYTKKDKMDVTVKNFEAKKKNAITQKDVDEYNSVVNAYSESVKKYNETNLYLNKYRSKRSDNFNKTGDTFFNKYL